MLCDLRARKNLCYAPDVLGQIEARRFHDTAVLELFRKSRQADEDYLRFNPSDIDTRSYLGDADYTIAGLLFRDGRIAEALQKARGATQVGSDRPTTLVLEDVGSLWPAIAV